MERFKDPDLDKIEHIAGRMESVSWIEMIHPTTQAYIGRQIMSALGYMTGDVTLDPVEPCTRCADRARHFILGQFWCHRCAQDLDS